MLHTKLLVYTIYDRYIHGNSNATFSYKYVTWKVSQMIKYVKIHKYGKTFRRASAPVTPLFSQAKFTTLHTVKSRIITALKITEIAEKCLF